MISCILLSAGLSQRFGSPKALADLFGETVIEHIQKMLLSAQVDEIIIVLGAYDDLIKPHLLKHDRIKFVYNKDYNLGQTTSFKVGLQGVSNKTSGVMLLPVDYPFIKADTANMLITYFLDNEPLILVPTYKSKKGHPPLFSMALRDEFLALDYEAGLNTIAHIHKTDVSILPVQDSAVVQTFNTREEFETAKFSL